MEISDIVQMEKEINQDKEGPLSWNNCLGDPSMRSYHEDKRKNQVTATAEKEDDTDSTATVATAAFTLVCESEWDDDIAERLSETTTLNNQIYVFGERQWVKLARKWRTSTSQVCKEENNPSLA